MLSNKIKISHNKITMKVVIAMDSFKGTLSADEACNITAEALKTVLPELSIAIKPMADGGEGTAKAIMTAANGEWVNHRVMGPLPEMQVDAGYAWFESTKTALVEMAVAAGLTLLPKEKLNPMKTTTYGVGQLIQYAATKGAKQILLAVGGSATVDGGTGAAAALGWRFLDAQAKPIPLGGEGLMRLAEILPPTVIPLPPIDVLCDVDNHLYGKTGAAFIFGPQKGATPAQVKELDKGLSHLASITKKSLGKTIDNFPGGGAAGGLAAGAIAFMEATLVSGIDAVMEASDLNTTLINADWIITGEGHFDAQSLNGKVISGIIKTAKTTQTQVAVLAGDVSLSKQEYDANGVSIAMPTKPKDMPLEKALAQAHDLLFSTAQKLAVFLSSKPTR